VVSTDSGVLIIGAGPAGLAIGACLARAGIPTTIIEKGPAVAPAWRAHYDRLHLHTVKQHSAMPYLPFPETAPKYPPRVQVIDYLEQYAQNFGLAPRFGEEARRVWMENGMWVCETNSARHVAAQVVVATGYNRTPHVPGWPGQELFRGTVQHSVHYRNGAAYGGQRVLVVGIGNTGAEIALDLAEHGAHVAVAVRSPVNIVPRDFRGRSTQVTAIRTTWLPLRLRDRVGRFISRIAFGDLTQHGLRRPKYGPAVQVHHFNSIPVIDVGTVAAIKAGRIRVVGDVARFTEDGVIFTDGTRDTFDHVVLATGFRANVASFLEGCDAALDERGYPLADGASPLPGLYFLGFAKPEAGILRQIAINAPELASTIKRDRATLARSHGR
jgi:indole-3-pyruvate monooxygenase